MNETSAIYVSPPEGFRLPAVHPGSTLASELAARSLSAEDVAVKLQVPPDRLSQIIAGRRRISAETALRLGRYFGTGAAFWANLQSGYDLAAAERRFGAKIDAEVERAS